MPYIHTIELHNIRIRVRVKLNIIHSDRDSMLCGMIMIKNIIFVLQLICIQYFLAMILLVFDFHSIYRKYALVVALLCVPHEYGMEDK